MYSPLRFIFIACSFACIIDAAEHAQSLHKKHRHEQVANKKNDAYRTIRISRLASRFFEGDRIETLLATDDKSGAKLGNILLRVFAHDQGKTVEVEYIRVFDGFWGNKIGARLMTAVPHFLSATEAIFVVSTYAARPFYQALDLQQHAVHKDEFKWTPEAWRKEQELFHFERKDEKKILIGLRAQTPGKENNFKWIPSTPARDSIREPL